MSIAFPQLLAQSWPGFHLPSGALWLLLLIPVIIFYFLKLRRPRVDISSLVLWRQVIEDRRVNSPFQKFKKHLLLFLQILMLCLFVLALMQPYIQADAERAEYLPILIDCSASMAATDKTGGKSRLDLAKEEVSRLIEGMLPTQRISLIAVNSTAQRLTDFSDNQHELQQALNKLTISQVGSELKDGLRMTQALSRTVPIEKVLLFTDGNVPERVDFELPFEINYQLVGSDVANIGITEFNARKSGFDRWDVFVRVQGSSDQQTAADLELLMQNEIVGKETVVLEAGESRRMAFEVTAEDAVSLQARLVPDGHDGLTSDNVSFLNLPEARLLTVSCSEDLGAYRHSLSSLEGLALFPGSAGSPPDEFDLLITEATDANPRSKVRLYIGVVPDKLQDQITMTDGLAEIVDWKRDDALLRYVQFSDVQISDDPKLADGVDDQAIEEQGFEIITHAQSGPLIVKDRQSSSEDYYLLFHPDRATLPYRVAFPVMATNLIELAFSRAALSDVRATQTGVLPALAVEEKQRYQIRTPDKKTTSLESNERGLLTGVAAPVIGQYSVVSGGNVVERVGVSLLSTLETSLKSTEELQMRELSVAAAEEKLDSDRPLWRYFAWFGFVVILLEWWFFNRPPVRI